jgi:hypothetical protein
MEENTTPPLERRCPACGAAMPQEARFCGACGMESPPPADAPAEQPATADSATAAVAEPTSAAPAPAAPATPAAPAAPSSPSPAAVTSGAVQANGAADGVDGRICPWCGAVNPPDGVRCVACDAVFPTPAGDEALERAAQARIQSMESDLSQRRAGWWPFRAR